MSAHLVGPSRRGIAAFVALVLLAFPATSQARNEQDALDQTRRELAQIKKKLAQARGEAAKISDQVDALDDQIDSLNRQIRDGKRRTSQLESDIRTAQAKISTLEARVAASRALINSRARELYKQAPVQRYLTLLESTSAVDFARRTVLMGVAADSDSKAIIDAGRLVGDLQDEKADLQSLRAKLDPERQRLEARLELVNSARNDRAEALSELQSQIQEDLAHEKDLEKESRELEAAIRASLSRSTKGGVSTKGFAWPVRGTITSPFGRRGGGFHPGMDIGAPTGTPIRAAKDGVVAPISCGTGYGICTIIDHGGGVSTLYAHQSRKAITSGPVKAGDVIGYVGCTGYCTGPHLHFEVRVDGSPNNPRGFLP
jgi:murein DD-endopeptidase MepM/ murein hydrolase activator NlpD